MRNIIWKIETFRFQFYMKLIILTINTLELYCDIYLRDIW